MSGMYGAIGIMMALRHRDATGEGQVIDMALYESVFRVLDEIAPRYAFEGHAQPGGWNCERLSSWTFPNG